MMATSPAEDLQKIAVKVFVADPSAVALETFVPVFHRWIQEHRVPGILVDVADYSHLPKSPGVLLVSHEANFAMDETEGPLGLLYTRKTPLEGGFADRLKSVIASALDACAKLEAEPEFKGALTFRRDEILFLANDRLIAPNSEETWRAIGPALASVCEGRAELARETADPRCRLTVRLRGAAVRPL